MQKIDDEFLKRIQATFIAEAEEHIRNFCSGLAYLEKNPAGERNPELIETMFREIHSLKGAARSVGNKETESLCQPLEAVFSRLKRKEIPYSVEFNTVFYRVADLLQKTVLAENNVQNENDRKDIKDLISLLNNPVTFSGSESIQPQQQVKIESTKTHTVKVSSDETSGNLLAIQTASDTIRININKLEPLFYQAEELLQVKVSLKQRITDISEIQYEIAEWIAGFKKWKAEKNTTESYGYKNFMEECKIRLDRFDNLISNVSGNAKRDHYIMGRMIDEHMESMKQVMMLPVSSLVESFPGMVREISGKLGKSVKLIITGSELEIDKRILEDLKVPLIHLLRNCIDHGIVRVRNGSGLQVASGTIRLDFATHENSHIEIKVSDDGDGINTESLIKSAIKSGILSEADALKIERKDAINLIFQSGLSTSQIITEISGHGLGMSIVREKISKINGTISIDSETGRGTTFTIVVPMSMATFRGISVRLNESIFILPSANVEKVLITPLDQIKTVENHDTISLADSIIPVVDLKEILGLSNIHEMAKGNSSIATDQSDKVNLIVVTADEKKAAFRVNEVSGEQQVLVKGLGALMPHVRNISGATILGNGKVVPILNPYDLLLSAKNGVVRRNLETSEVKQVEKSGRILVVEDSITSRTMLKNVLETAGYTVTTAVDGIDGYTKAKSESFDLIMSDVDMPRLNGFELTTRIRSDKNLSQMPVILLTSLDSREDREYGIEVGADAYMVKSSFDQGNLINVIRKLI